MNGTMKALSQDELGGPEVLKPGGILVSTQPPSLAPVAEAAAERGVRLAGLIVEADEAGMSALADVASTGQDFPLEQGGAAESGRHGPGKVALTMV